MKKRKYLTWEEVHHLLHTISQSAVPLRDYCMIYMTFLHGLRVSELTGLTLDDYDPRSQKLYIRRLKGGLITTHPLLPEESHVLSQWLKQRQRLPGSDLPWLFLSRQGGRLSRQRLYALIRQYGINAQLPIGIHPHMLRHACGYALADRGNDTRLIQDYLGYRNIRHTVAYTASNAERFSRAWMTNTEPPPPILRTPSLKMPSRMTCSRGDVISFTICRKGTGETPSGLRTQPKRFLLKIASF